MIFYLGCTSFDPAHFQRDFAKNKRVRCNESEINCSSDVSRQQIMIKYRTENARFLYVKMTGDVENYSVKISKKPR